MELKIGDVARVTGAKYKFVKLVDIDEKNSVGVLLYFNSDNIGSKMSFPLSAIVKHFKEFKCSGPWIVKYKGV